MERVDVPGLAAFLVLEVGSWDAEWGKGVSGPCPSMLEGESPVCARGVGTPAPSPGAQDGVEGVRPRGPKLRLLASAAVDVPLCNIAVLLERITSLMKKTRPREEQ